MRGHRESKAKPRAKHKGSAAIVERCTDQHIWLYLERAGVIGMRVSPGIVFPAHISLGIRVSLHIYH